MGSWSKWWAGELMVLITNYCRKSTLLGELFIYLFIYFVILVRFQVRDEYRTDYDPDILLLTLLNFMCWSDVVNISFHRTEAFNSFSGGDAYKSVNHLICGW